MARHNPASFAFGILFEIAAIVVIVSLLPRFDLRPQTAASEPEFRDLSPRVADLPAPPREEVVIPTSFTKSEEPRKDLVFTEPRIPKQLSSQEIEERLDRASQGLVNSLGSAAATAANDVLYSAGRPAVAAPSQPSFPTAEATSPSFTYLPPRAAPDSWFAARPADANGQVTPIQPWIAPQTTATRQPTTSGTTQPIVFGEKPPAATQTPRRWRNY